MVTALLVLSMSSSHVLLAGRTVFCHGLLRPDCLGLSLTYLRCAHDSSDVVTMKLFMMQWLSAVCSVNTMICFQAFVLGDVFDVSMEGAGIVPTLECRLDDGTGLRHVMEL